MNGEVEVRRIGTEDTISVALLRDFLLGALRHDAIHDVLIGQMAFHAEHDRLDARSLSTALPELIEELLAAAVEEDWFAVAEAQIDDYRDATGGEEG